MQYLGLFRHGNLHGPTYNVLETLCHKRKKNVETVVTDEPVQLEEETKKVSSDPKISAYADMLDRSNKNN